MTLGRIFSITFIILLIIPLFCNLVISNNELYENEQQFLKSSLELPDINISKIHGYYFTENLGQWDPEVLFMANTNFGHIGLGKGCIYYDLREIIETKENTNNFNFEETSENNEPKNLEIKGCVVKLTFENPNNVLPEGLDPLPHKSNYFLGNDSLKWATGVISYRRVIFEDLWDNIDLIYYFNNNGLKYEFIVHPGANHNNIKINVDGHSSLCEKNDGLIIDTPIKLPIIDGDLKIFYNENPGESINGGFEILNQKTYGFKINEYDSTKKIIIDPLLYSTYIGGKDWDECTDMAIDTNENIYITGYTESSDFLVTPGTYHTTFNEGNKEILVFKLNPLGSKPIFSTIIGGNGNDIGYGITIDPEENIYVTGYSTSPNFPNTTGAFDNTFNGTSDAFYFKLNKMGSQLLYSTYIGGNNSDGSKDIRLDSSKNIYIVGSSSSFDFPNTTQLYGNGYNGGYFDIFILKMNSDFTTLFYSTIIGGSGQESVGEMKIDSFGNVCLTGYTFSSNFPTTPNCYNEIKNDNNDIYVLKLNSDGSFLIFSTFIGGDSQEDGIAITLDSNLNIYITGITTSSNFPITEDAYDKIKDGFYEAFIIKLNYDGSRLLYSTFIGGFDDERGYDIILDKKENIIITGYTGSSNFPTSIDAYNVDQNGKVDIFITKFNNTGSDLLYSSFIGGSNTDIGKFIALDSEGNVIIAGVTKSTDFPTTDGSYDIEYNGGEYDIFILKLNLSIPPSTPQNVQINSGDSFVNLTWSPPLDDGGAEVFGYNILRKEDGGIYNPLKSVGNILLYSDTNVENGITYYYKISAVNWVGEGLFSTEVSATPMAIPTPPKDLGIVAGDGVIDLSWASPDDVGGSNVIKYRLYRGKTRYYESHLIDFVETVKNYQDTGVTNGQIYHYYITAVNVVGESDPSNNVSAVPLGLPTAPRYLIADAGDSFVNLTWQPPNDSGGAEITWYHIYRGSNPYVLMYFNSTNGTTLYYNDTSAINGKIYYYYIIARTKVGESITSNKIDALPLGLPSPPINLIISSGDGYIKMSWEKPIDTGGIDINEYRIFRSIEPGDLTYLNSVSQTTLDYNDTSVINGITYCYRIKAVNIVGESDFSDWVNSTPKTLALPPSIINAVGDEKYINLSWESPVDNGGVNITEYRIYRGEKGGEEIYLTTVDANGTYYIDRDLLSNKIYFYYITSMNEVGESDPSNEVNAFLIENDPNNHVPDNGNGTNTKGSLNSIYLIAGIGIIIVILILLILMVLKRKKLHEKKSIDINQTQQTTLSRSPDLNSIGNEKQIETTPQQQYYPKEPSNQYIQPTIQNNQALQQQQYMSQPPEHISKVDQDSRH